MFVNLTDLIEIASKLTLKRITNLFRITISYLISRWRKTPFISGLPISISIEPTTACNLRCPECPSGLRSFTRPTGKLEPGTFEKLINEVAHQSTYLTFYFQGEPYLNPDFLQMVEYANEQKMYTSTSTNAHFLSDEVARQTVQSGLSRIIISIDGITQESYESYRKEGSLDKVLQGTQNLLKWKKKLKSHTPTVIWQFLVVKPNEHEIPDLMLLAKQYKVDKVALKTAQIYDFQYGNPLIPDQDQYSRYRRNNDGTYSIKNKLLDHCWKMWSSCVITWDGKVIPCCFDKDAHHTLGELKTDGFKSIWYSKEYARFRKLLLKGRDQIDICKNCSEGTKIWA
jgi:radical SAM protein with 4Fe4S-binding SPASM domain